jgi:hypothetical protein
MVELLCFVLAVLAAPFKSRRRLEAENVILRHQLIVLRRKVPGRVRLSNGDRWLLVHLYFRHQSLPGQACRVRIPYARRLDFPWSWAGPSVGQAAFLSSR